MAVARGKDAVSFACGIWDGRKGGGNFKGAAEPPGDGYVLFVGRGSDKMDAVKPLSECRLYTFVDTAYLRGRAPEQVARELCDGGSDLIQLRAKSSSAAEIRRMAEAILPVTRRAGVGLVINDHLSVARRWGRSFAILGRRIFSTRAHGGFAIGKFQSSRVQIGLSTHAPDTGGAGDGGGAGLHRHRAGVCDRHEAGREASDAGICAVGGGERDNAVVRDWRHQFGQRGRGDWRRGRGGFAWCPRF